MGSPVPISVVRELAKKYGYDQVIVYARTVGEEGEDHMTTYGKNKAHCNAAAKIGNFLKYTIMGWNKSEEAKNVQIDQDIRTE